MSGAISVTTVASYAAIAGAALSTVSAIQQGNAAKAEANNASVRAQRDSEVAAQEAARARAIGAQNAEHATAMGLYQQRQAEADASVQQSEAQLQARQIREAGDRQRSAARAAMAGSGVTVGVGSAELIDKEINKNSEQDALLSIYQGDTRAQQIRAGGQIAADEGAATGRGLAYGAENQGRSLDAKSSDLTSLAADYRKKGKNAQTAGYVNAASSALSGAGRAASSWSSTAKGGDPIGDFYQRGTRGAGD